MQILKNHKTAFTLDFKDKIYNSGSKHLLWPISDVQWPRPLSIVFGVWSYCGDSVLWTYVRQHKNRPVCRTLNQFYPRPSLKIYQPFNFTLSFLLGLPYRCYPRNFPTGGVQVELHTFLALALDKVGIELCTSAALPLREWAPGTLCGRYTPSPCYVIRSITPLLHTSRVQAFS
jgi:hypothetical protein